MARAEEMATRVYEESEMVAGVIVSYHVEMKKMKRKSYTLN